MASGAAGTDSSIFGALFGVVELVNESFLLLARDPTKLVFSSPPVMFLSVFLVSLMTACFVVSIVMDNYSQVDRWWSILPVLVIGFFWYRSPVANARLTLMLIMSVCWGVRLTYNFWRKGGYNYADEDYRWQPLRKAITPFPVWLLFNAFFICIFQISLLYLIASPASIVYQAGSKIAFGSLDVFLLFLFFFLLSIESIADQQQWNFQNEKTRRREKGIEATGDYRLGFLTSGLFQFSRHPNFFAEISLWWVMYAFGAASTGQWLNWTVIGPILLTLLFQGSTNFTERLTLAKYPEYAKYQQTTSRLIPMFPGKPLHSEHPSLASPKKVPRAPKASAGPGSPKAVKKTSATEKPTQAVKKAPPTPVAPAATKAPIASPKAMQKAKKTDAADKITSPIASARTPGRPRKTIIPDYDDESTSSSSSEDVIISPKKRGRTSKMIASPKGRK